MTITPNVLLGAVVFVAAVLLLCIMVIFRLSAKLRAVQAEIDQQTRQRLKVQLDIDSLFARVDELHANITTFHNLITPLPEKIAQVEGTLREQVAEDPQVKLYQRAAKMAKQGASAQEIATACDLPEAEASILVSLNS